MVNSHSAEAVVQPFEKEVIQERPVSFDVAVEGPSQPFSQPNAAPFSEGSCPKGPPRVEGLCHGKTGERSPPFLLELFCGSAGVCAQFRTKGGRALGVDHHLKRSKLKAAAVQLDLTQPWVQDLIEREIRL